MQEFLASAREYAQKIEVYLRDNEWLLDKNFQQSLISNLSILDLRDLPQVSFPLRKEIEIIDAHGQANHNEGKQTVLQLIQAGDDSSLLLGVMLYMYITLRNYWSRNEEPILLKLQVLMAMLVKPEDLCAPISSIGVM